MMSVLERLQDHAKRSERRFDSDRRAAIFFSAAMLAFTSASVWDAWRDYCSAVPFRATVRAIEQSVPKSPDGLKLRFLVFDQASLPVVGDLIDGLFCRGTNHLLDNDSAELRVGDETILWRLPGENLLTMEHRKPFALSALPLLSACFLWDALRRSPRRKQRYLDRCLERGAMLLPPGTSEQWRMLPDGRAEVELAATGPSTRGRDLLCLGVLGWILAEVLLFVVGGVFAAACVSEFFARGALTLGFYTMPFFVLATLARSFFPRRRSRVAWNDSTVWVNGLSLKRSLIRRVAIHPMAGSARLQIQTASGFIHDVPDNAIWVGRILEKQGYPVEFSKGDLRSVAFSRELQAWWTRSKRRLSLRRGRSRA